MCVLGNCFIIKTAFKNPRYRRFHQEAGCCLFLFGNACSSDRITVILEIFTSQGRQVHNGGTKLDVSDITSVCTFVYT